MIIDIHNHITAKESPYYIPVETYLNAMDDAGVERAVILGKDYGFLGDRQKANLADEEVAKFVSAHPDRFIGFTGIHPDREEKENLEKIERAVQDYGLKGIKINPHAGFYPNDKRMYPVYQRAQDLALPVMCHTGVKAPFEGTRVKYCNPLYLDDVIVDFPNLTIIIAHAGYPWVSETILVALYTDKVFVDISTLNQLEETLGCAVILPTLKQLSSALGSSRILFGSDGIFNMEPIIEKVRQADFLSDKGRENIFWKNAQALLQC